jgi:hypothetical protein
MSAKSHVEDSPVAAEKTQAAPPQTKDKAENLHPAPEGNVRRRQTNEQKSKNIELFIKYWNEGYSDVDIISKMGIKSSTVQFYRSELIDDKRLVRPRPIPKKLVLDTGNRAVVKLVELFEATFKSDIAASELLKIERQDDGKFLLSFINKSDLALEDD